MKNNKGRKITLSVVGVFILFFLLATYGRWEYLTIAHGQEFVDLLDDPTNDGCMLPGESELDFLRVMKYDSIESTVYIKDGGVSFNLHPIMRDGSWVLYDEKKGYCRYAVYNSVEGSAEEFFHWYGL